MAVSIRLNHKEVRSGCGAGQGDKCCRYLLFGPYGGGDGEHGFFCGRESELKEALEKAIEFTARRIPTEAYPLCQIDGGVHAAPICSRCGKQIHPGEAVDQQGGPHVYCPAPAAKVFPEEAAERQNDDQH